MSICVVPNDLAGRTPTFPVRQPQPLSRRHSFARPPHARTFPFAVWTSPWPPVPTTPIIRASRSVRNVVVAPVSTVARTFWHFFGPQTFTTRSMVWGLRRRLMRSGYAPVAGAVNPWHPRGMNSADNAWKVRFGRMRLGSIVYEDGTVVPLDWRDLMWLVRGLRGEDKSGEEDAAIGWTMTNRLYALRNATFGRGPAEHRPPHRLHHMLLAYLQPINPYQRDRGTAEEIARRNHYATMGPDDRWLYPHSIRNAVRFLRGGYSRAPYLQWTHFAACGYGEGEHGEADARINDCFWIGAEGRALTARSVTIAPPKSSLERPIAAGSVFVSGSLALLKFAS